MGERVLYDNRDFVEGERLLQKIEGAEFGRFYRRVDGEAGARGQVVLDADGSVVLRHDMADDRETQAGAAIFRGKIGQEKFLLVIGADAAAGVRDHELDGLRGAEMRRDVQLLHERG